MTVELSDDAHRLLGHVRQLRNPRYPDALKLLGGHAQAAAALAELVDAGLLEHRSNGQLAIVDGRSVLAARRADVEHRVTITRHITWEAS